MKETRTIHSVDTELIYAALKLSFSKQYKIYCFNPLCQGFSNFFVLWPHFKKGVSTRPRWWISWISYVQPASRMRPSLGFRRSKSILHTDNQSLFW